MSKNTPSTFSREERNRIIADIMHWKCELMMDREFPPEDFQCFVEKLRELDDAGLKKFWEEHVGEWLASRSDLDMDVSTVDNRIVDWHECLSAGVTGEEPTNKTDFDEWLDNQFQKLVNGQDTDYGYVVSVSVRPRTQKATL
jgi:hypothetical protein